MPLTLKWCVAVSLEYDEIKLIFDVLQGGEEQGF